jgi:hypothetical protein
VAAQPGQMAAPDRLLRADLADAPFCAGVDRGRWRLKGLAYPHAVVEVHAAPRAGAPDWYAFRFNVVGYPQAPSAEPWDLVSDAPLTPASWPSGNARVQGIFNPGWRLDALYWPMDRLALEGHPAWRVQHACHVWDSGKDLTQYLRLIHDLLNDEGYTGVRG